MFGQPAAGGGAGQIGQGDYKIQSGDTLSDIAQKSGYGGDYNSLAQQNHIADPNKINAGDTINIGKPGGGGSASGGASSGGTPRASDSPSTNAVGGPLNQNSGGKAADDASAATNPTNSMTNPGLTTPPAPASNPAQTGSDAATPSTGTGGASLPKVDTSALGGSSGSSSGGTSADTSALSGASSGSSSDTSSIGGGSGGASSDTGSSGNDTSNKISSGIGAIGDVVNSVRGLIGGKYAVFADQADYDEWQKFAYPDAEYGPGAHKPFAGSGPRDHLEYSTSEEYADKARKKMDDVTDLGDATVYTSEEGYHPQASVNGGIRRAGKGATRHVEPVVVREQKPVKGGRQTIAHAPEFDDFDPYSRTAASFEDPYADVEAAAVRTAANGNDFVAEFQRNAGASIMSSGPSRQDNFDIAEAASGFLQRTAGRNYSLAEQAELIREGDIGGAGNLDSLDLRGTHYDESKHSIGLF